MKTFLLSFCLIAFSFSASAQLSIYDDVMALSKNITHDSSSNTDLFDNDPAKMEETCKILSKYLTAKPALIGNVVDSFTVGRNPYIGPFFSIPPHSQNALPGGVSLAGIASSLGGVDVTRFADGAAQFLIGRAKEELNVAFFSKLKDQFDKYPEIDSLFPETSHMLTNLLDYQYASMIGMLRQSFRDDLNALPANLEGLFNLPRYQQLAIAHPELGVLFASVKYVSELTKGEHPADVFSSWAKDPQWKVINSNVGNALYFGSILSDAFRTNQPMHPGEWITSAELKTLMTDNVKFKLFMGLLYHSTRFISLTTTTGTSVNIGTIIASQNNNLLAFQSYFTRLITITDSITSTLNKIRADKMLTGGKTIKICGYLDASVLLVDFLSDVSDWIPGGLRDQNVINGYLQIISKGLVIGEDVCSKNYTAGVIHLIELYQMVNDKVNQPAWLTAATTALTAQITALNTRIDSAAKADKEKLKDQKINLENEIKLLADLNLNNQVLMNVLAFAAAIVEAEKPEDVEKVIETFALPAGSSIIKKNTAFNFALQSYVGGYIGPAYRTTQINAWNQNMGITAPIGLAFSVGMRQYGSVSLFGSLLNIGSIVDFRLGSDSTLESKITLGNIVSPGAYFVYGFGRNIPLSIGFGGQYGPGLVRIKAADNLSIVQPYWRWNVFLAVDIPLANIAKGRQYRSKN